jgi:hypothetical protein
MSINMGILRNYKKALLLWIILYVLASAIGMSLWFFFSPIFSNLVMVTFTPLIIFVLARVYLKGVLVEVPEMEGLRLAAFWMIMGITTDVILYIIIAGYMTLDEYFVRQQPYMLLWNLAALAGGYLAGKWQSR